MQDNTLAYLLANEDGIIPPIEQVPIGNSPKLSDREDIFASAQTAKLLHDLGDEIEISEEDVGRAQELFESARVPTPHERKLPGVMLHLDAMLTKYDHTIIEDAQQVRTYVTNRLLEESNDDDPKIRLRALEMLGKISDVGLFTERKEITIRDKSTEDLTELLRAKLNKLMSDDPIDAYSEEIEDADYVDVHKKEALELAKSVTADEMLKNF
jgi:hypothetical protein